MCLGAESLSMGTSMMGAVGAGTTALGHLAQGNASAATGRAHQDLAEADALYAEDAAEKILRAARRQKSAARAATAASGVRLDEFSTGAEAEIDELSMQDAAMTILSGKRQGRAIRYGGTMARMAGENERSGSLFRAGREVMQGYAGWKGAKAKTTAPFYDGTTGDFAFEG
jgi:hypothetical protein